MRNRPPARSVTYVALFAAAKAYSPARPRRSCRQLPVCWCRPVRALKKTALADVRVHASATARARPQTAHGNKLHEQTRGVLRRRAGRTADRIGRRRPARRLIRALDPGPPAADRDSSSRIRCAAGSGSAAAPPPAAAINPIRRIFMGALPFCFPVSISRICRKAPFRDKAGCALLFRFTGVLYFSQFRFEVQYASQLSHPRSATIMQSARNEGEYIEAAIAGGYQTLGTEHAPYQFSGQHRLLFSHVLEIWRTIFGRCLR